VGMLARDATSLRLSKPCILAAAQPPCAVAPARGFPAGRPDELFSDPPADTHKVARHLGKENRYVIRVKGDSMAPRIQDGDLILVDYIKEPRPGNTVVTTVNGGVLVKKYLLRDGRVVLKSTNPQYADIEVKETG
jgi:phage repressor protein C with HTH and peptisase S24 domain